jgi:hypothetical protein
MNRVQRERNSLEMEERHIAQFEMLITKQELLLTELERGGYVEVAKQAHDILDGMQALLRFARERHSRLLQAKR